MLELSEGFLRSRGLGLRSQAAFLGCGLKTGEPEVVGRQQDKAGLCWA